MADNNKVEVAAIHAGEAGNQRAHRNIAAANAELIRKAPLLIEAVAALELAKATIERLTVRHGPFSSTDGTVSVINSLLAKLDAE
jgi:multidrug resistance efflux pump